MIGIAIVVLAAVVYVIGFVVMTRRRYARTRLLTEPVNCYLSEDATYHEHGVDCYRQNPNSTISSPTDALVCALLLGMIWPSVLLAAGAIAIGHAIVMNTPETPAEHDARIKRLEDENGIKRIE
jgi:hypothetical protein